MSALFYSMQEAARKLNKTEDEVRTIAEKGVLREFRHEAKVLFKREEVEAMTPYLVDIAIERALLTETPGQATLEPELLDVEVAFEVVPPKAEETELTVLEQKEANTDTPAPEVAGRSDMLNGIERALAQTSRDTNSTTETPSTGDPYRVERIKPQQSMLSKSPARPVSTVNARSASHRLTPWQWFVTGLAYDRPGPVLLLFLALHDNIWRSAVLIYIVCKLF